MNTLKSSPTSNPPTWHLQPPTSNLLAWLFFALFVLFVTIGRKIIGAISILPLIPPLYTHCTVCIMCNSCAVIHNVSLRSGSLFCSFCRLVFVMEYASEWAASFTFAPCAVVRYKYEFLFYFILFYPFFVFSSFSASYFAFSYRF